VGLLATFGWTMWSFNLTRQQEINSFNRTKQKEIDFAYWNRKATAYLDLLRFASLLSTANPPLRDRQEYHEFYETYFGAVRAYCLGDDNVISAAKEFEGHLEKAADNTNATKITDYSGEQLQSLRGPGKAFPLGYGSERH